MSSQRGGAVTGSVLEFPPSRACANVLGVPVDVLDMESALGRIGEWLRRRRKGYVCAASVHGVLESRQDVRVARAFAEADMVIPDGRPMVWVARAQGKRAMRQVTGPDMMAAIMSRPEFAEGTIPRDPHCRNLYSAVPRFEFAGRNGVDRFPQRSPARPHLDRHQRAAAGDAHAPSAAAFAARRDVRSGGGIRFSYGPHSRLRALGEAHRLSVAAPAVAGPAKAVAAQPV